MAKRRRINPTKTSVVSVNEDQSDEMMTSGFSDLKNMQQQMNYIFGELSRNSNSFKSDNTFESLYDYIKDRHRILYFEVSNIVYGILDDDFSDTNGTKIDQFGTLLSNIERLVEYTDTEQEITRFKELHSKDIDEKVLYDTRKAVWKIWDHVNLAHRQYEVLRQSKSEFKRRFDEQIKEPQEALAKEINAQLITLVSIFTALAFVLFGGVSSLQSVLQGLQSEHLLKLLVLGCMWGICLLNVVFVFLFCVGKMTSLSFKSSMHPKASFLHKYPVVCWSNHILICLFALLFWLYCCSQSDITCFQWIINISPHYMPIIGCAIIITIFVVLTIVMSLLSKSRDIIS